MLIFHRSVFSSKNLIAKCKTLEDQLNDLNKKLSEQEVNSSNNQESLKQQVELISKKDEEIQVNIFLKINNQINLNQFEKKLFLIFLELIS